MEGFWFERREGKEGVVDAEGGGGVFCSEKWWGEEEGGGGSGDHGEQSSEFGLDFWNDYLKNLLFFSF